MVLPNPKELSSKNFSLEANSFIDQASFFETNFYQAINHGHFSNPELASQHEEIIDKIASQISNIKKLAAIHNMAATISLWQLTSPLDIFNKIIEMNYILKEEQNWIWPFPLYGIEICNILIKMITIRKLEEQYGDLLNRLKFLQNKFNETLTKIEDTYTCKEKIEQTLNTYKSNDTRKIVEDRYNATKAIMQHIIQIKTIELKNKTLNIEAKYLFDAFKEIYPEYEKKFFAKHKSKNSKMKEFKNILKGNLGKTNSRKDSLLPSNAPFPQKLRRGGSEEVKNSIIKHLNKSCSHHH
ncbi:MAG: hypothetical protein GY821_01775 [Gammaproteobacteria bacterium]|nr:hypothetical protein [Gammaproteobacteria bacterium]